MSPDPRAGGKDEVVRIMCPKLGCQRVLAVPAQARGKLVRCRSCGTNVKVPARAIEQPAAPEQSQQQQKPAA